MKTHSILTLIAISLLFAGCSSVGSSVSSNSGRPDDSISDDMNYYRSLADFLENVPGVNIQGQGNNAYITIRGISSFNTTNEPLYVIDGHAVGNSYIEANRIVSPNDIDYVRVLKGPDASIYGVRGANGVIEIVTRRV
jgi:TonB-dependent SusC/RagA subfamily outer membrane receptor